METPLIEVVDEKKRRPRPPTKIKYNIVYLIHSAMNYSTRIEWSKGDKYAYMTAQSNGWLNLCCSHMPKNLSIKYSSEEVFETCSRYSDIYEWKRDYPKHYRSATRRKIIGHCIRLLKPTERKPESCTRNNLS